MRYAVLSGKGGTGKTTVATNLAKVMGAIYADCDVEEPNGHIFLQPQIDLTKEVTILNPNFTEKCTGCGACVKACQFNALAKSLDKIMLFEELCHGCGACSLACPEDAIIEKGRPVGLVKIGKDYIGGCLNIKEPMGGPVITAVKKEFLDKEYVIDSAPGTSCNVVKALDDVNYAVLVTEPTLFGLHDLKLAVELVRALDIPFGIVLNRAKEDRLIEAYCEEEKIQLLGKIPFSKQAAQMYSRGQMLVEDPNFEEIFKKLSHTIKEAACN